MRPATQTEPRFVNLQHSAVQVYTPTRHPITILPWEQRKRMKPGSGTFVVEGGHYQQFVSGAGPLYPFPADEDHPPGPLPQSEDALHASVVSRASLQARIEGQTPVAQRGRFRATGDVVREGTIIGESQQAFLLRLRRELAVVGITDALAFRQAPKHTLFKVEGVTEDSLARFREMEAELFPAAPTPVPTGKVTTLSPDADPGDEATEPEEVLTVYPRPTVEALNIKGLRDLIDTEGFQMSKGGSLVEIRTRVLAALEEHKMLSE